MEKRIKDAVEVLERDLERAETEEDRDRIRRLIDMARERPALFELVVAIHAKE